MTERADLIAALEPLVRRVRTDVTAKKGATGMGWTREALTDQRLAKHLNGGPARGVCPIKAGESVTMVALLDLDSHKGETSWGEMTGAALKVTDALEARGLRVIPFRSSGGRGIHLYTLWDHPQDAYSVRTLLTQALLEAGYRNGTAGVSRGEIEVFPKQDSVPADGFGNQFILPLAGESEPLDPLDLSPMGKDAATLLAWASSEPVPVLERPVREVAAVEASGDLVRLRAALAAIPNEGTAERDYDEWRNIIFAIHHATGGSDAGHALAHEFSARSGKYDPEFFDGRVWPYVRDREGGVTEQTIYAIARQHGWDAPTAEEFPVVVVEPTPEEPAEWPPMDRDAKGKIEPTVNNALKALRRPDICGAHLGQDDFKDSVCISWGGDGAWRPLRDTDYTRLRETLEQRGFKKPGRELVRDAVLQVAEDNRFDSAIQWAQGLVWDGVPRVEAFLGRYMGVAADSYASSVSRYLWTALAGRLLVPGCKADMVPVLVGGQGTGKSTGVMAMAPEPDAYVELNLEVRDDNLARSLRGKLVGELGELRGLNSKEAEAIKAWVTRTHEEWIPKYVEFATKFPRRLVFIGTTNSDEFLADDTGERRWLPVEVGTVDVDAIERDRDQLWAEGVVLFKQGGVQWRDALELGATKHDDYKVTDAWQDTVERWLALDDMDDTGGVPRGQRPFKIENVLASALGLSVDRVGMREQKRAGSVLRRLGYTKRRATRSEGGKFVWERAENCGKEELA